MCQKLWREQAPPQFLTHQMNLLLQSEMHICYPLIGVVEDQNRVIVQKIVVEMKQISVMKS